MPVLYQRNALYLDVSQTLHRALTSRVAYFPGISSPSCAAARSSELFCCFPPELASSGRFPDPAFFRNALRRDWMFLRRALVVVTWFSPQLRLIVSVPITAASFDTHDLLLQCKLRGTMVRSERCSPIKPTSNISVFKYGDALSQSQVRMPLAVIHSTSRQTGSECSFGGALLLAFTFSTLEPVLSRVHEIEISALIEKVQTA